MLSTTALLLTSLLPQNPGVGVKLDRLPSTIRLGEVVMASLVIQSRQPPGSPVLPEIAGIVMRLGRPSSSQSFRLINGRQSQSFSWSYPLEVRATALGLFKLLPITVKVGGKTYRTRERVLKVVKQVTDAQFGRVSIRTANKRVYVHEPIRFDIEYAIDGNLHVVQQMAQNGAQFLLVKLDAAWLTEMDGAQRIEHSDVVAGQTFNTVLNDIHLQPANVAVGKGQDGKTYRLFRYSKSFLPTRAGRRRLPAPVLKFSVETGRRRGGFGLFSTPEVHEYLVYGEDIEIQVLPLPSEGRPDPYFGGVGRFTIAATLSKGRVKVGESLKLRVTISGRGNTEYLQVPDPGELPGFHRLGKNINREDGEVVVTFDLMPTTATVSEVPALQWNFFDTTEGIEKYVEVMTRPLPLVVQPIEGAASLAALPGEAKKAVELGVDDIFDLHLAGSTSPAALPLPTTSGLVWLACLAPWLVALFGSWFMRARRRSRADVQGRRRKAARREFDKALAAGDEPLDALVAYLADRLGCEAAAIIEPDLDRRLVAAGFRADHGEQIRQIVECGVAARYSGGEDAGVDRAQVESLVRLLEGISVRSGAPASALVKVLLASIGTICSGIDLAAQEPSAQLNKGEAAYRARDYPTAAAEFAAAADRGDRIAAYNLGNTRYRQGRFPEALVAYERARLVMPRDPELLANIRLVRKQLDLQVGEEAFGQTLASIRDSLTAAERLWVCILLNLIAALLVCFGSRRLRIMGAVVTLLAVVAIVEVAILGPGRPPMGIVLDPEVAMRAEPDARLEARLTIIAGVSVEVLSRGSGWTKIRAEGHTGYVESASIAVVE